MGGWSPLFFYIYFILILYGNLIHRQKIIYQIFSCQDIDWVPSVPIPHDQESYHILSYLIVSYLVKYISCVATVASHNNARSASRRPAQNNKLTVAGSCDASAAGDPALTPSVALLPVLSIKSDKPGGLTVYCVTTDSLSQRTIDPSSCAAKALRPLLHLIGAASNTPVPRRSSMDVASLLGSSTASSKVHQTLAARQLSDKVNNSPRWWPVSIR